MSILLLMKIELYHSISFEGGAMPREIDGKTYYEATEVCESAGISRPTLFRWLKRGLLTTMHKDRRGWRLFTEEDLNKIRAEATRIEIGHVLVNAGDRGARTSEIRRPSEGRSSGDQYANRRTS
jgi:hypothetical protein